LPFGERSDGEFQRAGLLIHEEKRCRLRKNDAPRDVQNGPQKLIIVGNGIDETADFDKTFVDV
jgi:hypothetical protein